jgi:hypothetical protein
MKRIAAIIVLIGVLITPVFASTEAIITEVVGRVELKHPGKGWRPAAEGMLLQKGTVISTGFKALARLEVGQTEIFVKQLTRMELQELLQREGTQTTQLYLQVGKVRANVKTTSGLKHDFVMKSPICTAAVRGTVFDFDTIELNTDEGLVALYSPRGLKTFVAPGDTGSSTGGKDIATGGDKKEQGTNVDPKGRGVKRKVGQIFSDMVPRNLTGGVLIKWEKL